MAVEHGREGRHHASDRSDSGVLLGAALGTVAGIAAYALWRATRDRDGIAHRPADSAPGRTSSQERFGRFAVTGRTVTIGRPRHEIYEFWRAFENLEHVMEGVSRVRADGNRTRWTIEGPLGQDVHVETDIVSDRPGDQIAWRSTPRSQIETEGKIRFKDAPGTRGTEVEAIIAWVPPAGSLGRWVARLFQADPAIQGRRDLKRLKMFLETGEVATSANRKAS